MRIIGHLRPEPSRKWLLLSPGPAEPCAPLVGPRRLLTIFGQNGAFQRKRPNPFSIIFTL